MANNGQLTTVKTLRDNLLSALPKIENALPKALKGEAERLVQISIVAFATAKNRVALEKCDPVTYVQAFMDAAAAGFALDNKNAYAIPYGRDVTCQFDYKAIVTCARRTGAILDAHAQEVCKNDKFEWWDENGKRSYRFQMAEDEDDRGPLRGAFAVANLPGDLFRFEYMPIKELLKIRQASKSPESPAWKNWEHRMYCKAPLKRTLQGLEMDSSFGRMLEVDNREYDMDRVIDGKASPARIQTYDDLADVLDSQPMSAAPAIEHHDDIPSFGMSDEYLDAEPAPMRQERPAARATSRPSIGNHPSGVR